MIELVGALSEGRHRRGGYISDVTGRAGALDIFLSGYLALTIRLDRLVPGLVDTGNIDSALRARVMAEPAPTAADLVRRTGRLADELADLPMEPVRRDFLARQLRAVECVGRRLAGQAVPFRQEIQECFDVIPRTGAVDRYAEAHAELDALLPGPEALAVRLSRYRRAQELPRHRLEVVVEAVAELLRARTRGPVPLPPAEAVRFRIVDDAPWSALHSYLGDYRSLVTVNAGARLRWPQLVQIVAHESYPGHHAERCRKQAGIVAGGWLEHGVLIANSPQSLIAEGAAELGLDAVVGPGWGPLAADVLAGLGLRVDGELAEQVAVVSARLVRVRQDAALLLHDRRAPVDQVVAHLSRWLLVDEARARQMLRFLRHPVWRAYTTTYVEGPELLGRWWARDPGPERLRRLLDEPLTPTAIRAELAS